MVINGNDRKTINIEVEGENISIVLLSSLISSDPIASIKVHKDVFKSIYPLDEGATKPIAGIKDDTYINFYFKGQSVEISFEEISFTEGSSPGFTPSVSTIIRESDLRDVYDEVLTK